MVSRTMLLNDFKHSFMVSVMVSTYFSNHTGMKMGPFPYTGSNINTKKVSWMWTIYNDRTVYRRLIRLFYRNPILGALLFNLFYCIGEVTRVLFLFLKNEDSVTFPALIFIESEIVLTTFCIFCIHGVRNLSEEQVSHFGLNLRSNFWLNV